MTDSIKKLNIIAKLFETKIIKLCEKPSDRYDLTNSEKQMLSKIDNCEYHLLKHEDVLPEEEYIVKRLLRGGLLRLVDKPRFKGYAISEAGAWAMGMFDQDNL
jgi:hypothetical protein